MRARFLLAALLLVVPVAREARVTPTGETVIRGVVFDSLRMRPLAEANVQIASTTGQPWTKSYNTDSKGTFELVGVPNGTYLDRVLPRGARLARPPATDVPSGCSIRTADSHAARDSIGANDRARVMRPHRHKRLDGTVPRLCSRG